MGVKELADPPLNSLVEIMHICGMQKCPMATLSSGDWFTNAHSASVFHLIMVIFRLNYIFPPNCSGIVIWKLLGML